MDPTIDPALFKQIQFKKDELIFKEGDHGFCFYIIQDGQVEIFKKDKNGHRVVLNILGVGQPMGEFALVTQSPRSATARAVTDGYAIEVSEAAYKQLFSELPDWAKSVVEGLIHRLKKANDLITEATSDASGSVKDRIIF